VAGDVDPAIGRKKPRVLGIANVVEANLTNVNLAQEPLRRRRKKNDHFIPSTSGGFDNLEYPKRVRNLGVQVWGDYVQNVMFFLI